MQSRKLLPPVYLYIAIALIAILHGLIPGPQIMPSPWRYLGVVPVVLGAVLNILADRAFKRCDTTVKPFEESAFLVTEGAFRFSRNPMYAGFALLLVGLVMLLGSAVPWIVVIGFPFVMQAHFIQVEESMLEARFGADWLAYKRRVRRWL
jgi:protein-S-isoprenylcysteine O-methyltransferase Ste14